RRTMASCLASTSIATLVLIEHPCSEEKIQPNEDLPTYRHHHQRSWLHPAEPRFCEPPLNERSLPPSASSSASSTNTSCTRRSIWTSLSRQRSTISRICSASAR